MLGISVYGGGDGGGGGGAGGGRGRRARGRDGVGWGIDTSDVVFLDGSWDILAVSSRGVEAEIQPPGQSRRAKNRGLPWHSRQALDPNSQHPLHKQWYWS